MNVTVLQVVTPYITTLMQIALAVFLYWVKDHDPCTRGYDRYAKRFQFHKAEYELRQTMGLELTEDCIKFCTHGLQNSATWVSANLTRASKLSKGVALAVTFLCMPYVASAALPAYLNSMDKQHHSPQSVVLSAFLIAFFAVSYKLYAYLKKLFTRELLSLSKHKRFSYLGDFVDD